MNLELPDKVKFIEPYNWETPMKIRETYCFKHAVKRAMNNQRIDTVLTENATACIDCDNEIGE